MRFSSTAALFALSSLCASYVLPFVHPQQASDNLMRRELPYAVVNVDGDDQTTSNSHSSSSSKTSPVIQTAVQTMTASSPPSPPVTVTVTTTASSTPIISSFPCSSNSRPVSGLSLPPLSRAGTLITAPSPRPSSTASLVSGQTSSGSLTRTARVSSTTDHN
ncbi:uncharacterized protein EURHEDRAFT_412878 [Aspergillus ruber CBS 135680]|uniref:Uncharacterized protein n=1 Tax=Aspergillus ruber (strain CBS 135680) TaxID=1388766 RepID=A0A017SC22_ASPRC|nr:uncharacterized protein EURHEDRAFT_412878 [Aspergillus ruber CBS 135680]EYE94553.1 hypothetical protein EURHEDRAFT_412878 [Aspergillus ruber CBS 135680]